MTVTLPVTGTSRGPRYRYLNLANLNPMLSCPAEAPDRRDIVPVTVPRHLTTDLVAVPGYSLANRRDAMIVHVLT